CLRRAGDRRVGHCAAPHSVVLRDRSRHPSRLSAGSTVRSHIIYRAYLCDALGRTFAPAPDNRGDHARVGFLHGTCTVLALRVDSNRRKPGRSANVNPWSRRPSADEESTCPTTAGEETRVGKQFSSAWSPPYTKGEKSSA